MNTTFHRGIRAILVFLVGLILVACAPSQNGLFFRDTKARITSTTRFEENRFAGFWHIRQEFAQAEEPLFRSGVAFEHGGDGTIQGVILHGIRANGTFGLVDRLKVNQVAAGRLVNGSAPYDTQYWVLWVDADYRTAVIGTPSGSFGWIIDRKRTGGADRIKAARDILDWNGYDLRKLREIPQ